MSRRRCIIVRGVPVGDPIGRVTTLSRACTILILITECTQAQRAVIRNRAAVAPGRDAV
jgi:hypothetical protein